MKNVLIAALLGALTVFLFGFVVYGVLGLHLKTISSFENPSAVAAMLKANAPEAGMYFLPNVSDAEGKMVEEDAYKAAAKAGPWAMLSIHPAGRDMEDVTPMGRGFVIEFLAALVAACMVRNMRPNSSYGCRVLLVASLGVFAGLVDPILNWNWLGDAISFSFFTAGMHVLTWLLGGLVIAKFAVPKP